jgi:hypothetical protein
MTEGVTLPATLPDGQDFVVACVVAPDSMEQAVSALRPEDILARLWWVDELLRRANALKKGLLIEATMAMDRGEMLEHTITVAGHRHVLRQDQRVQWRDLGSLLGMLETVHGIPGDELRAAVSDARVTDLREAAGKIDDPDLRADALASIEDARVKVPTTLALVDIDDPYRRGP